MRNQRPELSSAVLDSLIESVAMIDARGVIVGVNQAWRNFASSNHGECTQFFVGQDYLAICERASRHGDDPIAIAMYEGLRGVLEGRLESFSLEYPCHGPTEQRWFTAHVTRCQYAAEPSFVIAHEDITVRKLAELKVERTERMLRLLLEALPIGVWLTDADGTVIHTNAAGLQIWSGGGDHPEPWPKQGRRLTDNSGFDCRDWAAAASLSSGEPCPEEALLVEGPGGQRKVLLHATVPLKDAEGQVTGAVIVDRDITRRHAADEQLRLAKLEADQANHALAAALVREQAAARSDELTGLANRRHLYALGSHLFSLARRYQQPLAVIMFDLDHFKMINDRHGHQIGDRTLQRIARLAELQLRSVDLLARYGGEEFVIALPQTGASGALEVAERIRCLIAEQVLTLDRVQLQATISAGIAEISSSDDSLDRLIGRADTALYLAKNGGRNRCVLAVDARPTSQERHDRSPIENAVMASPSGPH